MILPTSQMAGTPGAKAFRMSPQFIPSGSIGISNPSAASIESGRPLSACDAGDEAMAGVT